MAEWSADTPVRTDVASAFKKSFDDATHEAAEKRSLADKSVRAPRRNRLIWGDKKYVLSSLMSEFAGKVNLIYIDPPFTHG